MNVVMGALNGIFLSDLHFRGLEHCDFVQAAVAYAHGGHDFFDLCRQADKRLQYYGLLLTCQDIVHWNKCQDIVHYRE